jgi:hypothetical protein
MKSVMCFPWKGTLQNAVLNTFGAKALQIFSCSIQKVFLVKPEYAVLAGMGGWLASWKPLSVDPWDWVLGVAVGIPFFY